MWIPGVILSAGLSFFFLLIMLGPLERAFPAKQQPFFRKEWWTDLCFFLGQYFVWTSVVLALLLIFRDWLYLIVPADFRAAVAAQPVWLQFIQVVILSDLFVYWGHRLQHRFDFLWRFHAVHHTSEHLDWLAAHREHPLDTVWTGTMINLPGFILGVPLETLALLNAFRGLWAIYIHSNVRLPTGPLRVLFGAPELHHWHHSRERHSSNFANLSPIMDLIFGTYKCPDHEPEALGIEEPFPRSYLGQMFYPFRIKNRTNQADSSQLASNRTPNPVAPIAESGLSPSK